MKQLLVACALSLSLIACSEPEPEHQPQPQVNAVPGGAGEASTAVELAALGIKNAVVFDSNLASSGQPTEEQFAALPAAGYTHVICTRPASEAGTGWEEERAKELGISFVRIPVAGADDLDEGRAHALDEALQAAGDAQVLVCCGSGNRVGGLFAMRAYFLQGRTPEEALAYGKQAGLTKLEPAVRAKLGL